MKILILTFYYPPDLSAGSFRAAAVVRALKKRVTASDTIEVVTTMPNRYISFRQETKEIDRVGNVIIRRIPIPVHQSGFSDQAKSFIAYFNQVRRYIRDKDYDIVFATSSRLFTAFLGALVARRKKLPLYLDIRDIFVDTMKPILGRSALKVILPALGIVEKWTINQATTVNLISPGFRDYFDRRYRKAFSFFPHGIDQEFLGFTADAPQAFVKERARFLYAGNIGSGQGLDKIIPFIVARYPEVEFTIIGDGGKRNLLVEKCHPWPQVRILPPVDRVKLIEFYQNSDVLFLHLNDFDAFKKVLPSKIFEYAAMAKPIVAGVGGYAREFLKLNVPDSLVFAPCDIDDFSRQYDSFSGKVDVAARQRFIDNFSREKIMDDMAVDILTLHARVEKREARTR